MLLGTVKSFNKEKGFGFIESAEYGEVFVHYTAIHNFKDYKTLDILQKVNFLVAEGKNGPQAVMVKVI